MYDSDWCSIAIRNNKDWYTAQANSWRLPFHVDEHHWWSKVPLPPFHSNLVASGAQPDALIEEIHEALQQTQTPASWSIKDAHGCHQLAPNGFSVLFEAQWIAIPPAAQIGPLRIDHTQVCVVCTASELTQWVEAWGETPPGAQIFRPALLENPLVRLLYVESHGKIAGGLAINKSTGAIGAAIGAKDVIGAMGISNWFGATSAVRACLAYTANQFPNLGVVGYERDPARVQQLREIGFKAVGELTIWTC